jgi:paraquat-inducible protein A
MLIACKDCGTIQSRPSSLSRGRIECAQCDHLLESKTGRSLDGALACSFTTLVLLVPANVATGMTVHLMGITMSSHLPSGLSTAWRQGWPGLSIALGLLVLVLPFARFALLTTTLLAIRIGYRRNWVSTGFRIAERLDPWAMADVLLLGGGIGYGRIASQIPVTIDVGGWCLVGAAVMTMLTRATLDQQAVWRRIDSPKDYAGSDAIACHTCDLVLPPAAEGSLCPRCRARVRRRRPNALAETTALLLATVFLIPIAYGYPMSALWEAGTPQPHTIGDGIMLLFTHGFWYFGVIIFCVSVAFPMLKIVTLAWCLASVWRRSEAHLRRKTKLYRFVDDAGRWSALDPFTVLTFAPMVQLQQLAHIDFMRGCPAFLATVVLSMLAAQSFDPRLMWDAARARKAAAP